MRRRILIIDPLAGSEVDIIKMTEYLKDFDIYCCDMIEEAFNAVLVFDPDFIYINGMVAKEEPLLAFMHDIYFLTEPTPLILGVTSIESFYVEQLRSLNVRTVLIMPHNIEALCRALCELATFSYPINNGYVYRALDYILIRLGFKCSGVKYECIQYAVELRSQNATMSVMKELYPALAKKVNGTPSSVEKGIRDAIRIARDEGDPKIWKAFFRFSERGDAVSNDDFISRLVVAVKDKERPRISIEDFLSDYCATK